MERLSKHATRSQGGLGEHDYLLISDIHLDSIHCERELLKKHLDKIKEKNGKIFIFGDLFDVMATYGDKRMQREDVDPGFVIRGRSYLDLIVEYAIEFLMPYRDNIALISKGNHESVIEKYHNTDIISRVIYALSPKIMQGGYKGWHFFAYRGGSCVRTHRMHYHHGFGGNARRSKGILDVQIEVMKYPDANLLVRGHTHQKWHDPSTTREKVSQAGRVFVDSVDYLQLGSYKNGATSTDGWEVEKNFSPTKMGGWFVNQNVKKGDDITIDTTIIEAK